MCTVCISSRTKEYVTSVNESRLYVRHILKTTEALTNGTKCQCMCLPVWQARKGPTGASDPLVTMLKAVMRIIMLIMKRFIQIRFKLQSQTCLMHR